MNINAATELFCIFGNPVNHSLSPVMHNAAFAASGMNAVYMAFQPAGIRDALAAMRALPITGASITSPFKTAVMDFLDDVDSLALDIGSVNTLHYSRGKLKGYNTDGYGALMALVEAGIGIRGTRFLVIGNGGSARAIAFTLLQAGGEIVIAGRNAERIAALAGDLKEKSSRVDHILLPDLTSASMKGTGVVINTTPAGMEPDTDCIPLEDELILPEHALFDIVYAPHWTRFLLKGKQKGCRVLHGIEMLIYQGAKQFELWTGRRAPADVMRAAVGKHLSGQKADS